MSDEWSDSRRDGLEERWRRFEQSRLLCYIERKRRDHDHKTVLQRALVEERLRVDLGRTSKNNITLLVNHLYLGFHEVVIGEITRS